MYDKNTIKELIKLDIQLLRNYLNIIKDRNIFLRLMITIPMYFLVVVIYGILFYLLFLAIKLCLIETNLLKEVINVFLH